jgi:hypothetical protein
LDNSVHENINPEIDKPQARVPRFIFVVIIAILGAMYWYAAYGDTPAPEKTVKTFYQAYFDRDFDTVAENLSVFWSVRFLPEYADMTPAELLNNRTKVEAEISKVIAEIESENTIPEGVSIEVLKEYTKMGKSSAIVVYQFIENGKETGMETALLIKEKDQFRILNMSPVDAQTLEQIKSVDINTLDKNVDSLLSGKTE